jgi:hypothetical protein
LILGDAVAAPPFFLLGEAASPASDSCAPQQQQHPPRPHRAHHRAHRARAREAARWCQSRPSEGRAANARENKDTFFTRLHGCLDARERILELLRA